MPHGRGNRRSRLRSRARRPAGNVTIADAEPETWKNFQFPLWLLIGGVVIEIIPALFRGPTFNAAMKSVGIEIIFGTAVILAGVLIAAFFRRIKLGSFWTVIFKISAISVAPSAAADLLTPAFSFVPFGILFIWAGEFAFYFALIGLLFDLDETDTWFFVWIIFIIRVAAYITLRQFL